uniref:ATP synthase subunit 5, mitochondrial n=1 Tax=Melanopsichium pennsylvanicum 4 TaxID=1398559 RepID=A0A077R2R0_9BASI|nr:uncharacterized protein BN887_04233 [Melanopsichium pennsylvanicum 4]
MVARFAPRLFQVGVISNRHAFPTIDQLPFIALLRCNHGRLDFSSTISRFDNTIKAHQLSSLPNPYTNTTTDTDTDTYLARSSYFLSSHFDCTCAPLFRIVAHYNPYHVKQQQATRGYASQAAVRAPKMLDGLAGMFSLSYYLRFTHIFSLLTASPALPSRTNHLLNAKILTETLLHPSTINPIPPKNVPRVIFRFEWHLYTTTGKYASSAYVAALSKDSKTLEKVEADLKAVQSALSGSEGAKLKTFIENPTLSGSDRTKGIDQLLAQGKAKADPITQ